MGGPNPVAGADRSTHRAAGGHAGQRAEPRRDRAADRGKVPGSRVTVWAASAPAANRDHAGRSNRYRSGAEHSDRPSQHNRRIARTGLDSGHGHAQPGA